MWPPVLYVQKESRDRIFFASPGSVAFPLVQESQLLVNNLGFCKLVLGPRG